MIWKSVLGIFIYFYKKGDGGKDLSLAVGIWTLSDQSKLTYSLTSSRILEVPFTGLVMTDCSLDILYPLHHPSDKGKSYYFLWLDWLESNQLPIRYERTALTKAYNI